MKANIIDKFNQLPPDLQEKAIKYINSLLTQKESRQEKKPKLDWVGGLKEYRDQYTALELQKEAVDWWERSALDHIDPKRKEPVKGLK